MTTNSIPSLRLYNGVTLPALGFGVFQTPPHETKAAVEAALRVGYRHIDTAAAYGNEREVGEAIAASGVPRNEIIVETKIWISDYGFESTLNSFEKSARKLGLDQIDIVLLHQPLPSAFESTIEAYRALESLLVGGKVRAIGVSNFIPDHLRALLAATSIVPSVNQIEVHPYFQQKELQALHAEHGILTQAWSPIGGITFYPGYGDARKSTLEEPVLVEIANAHGKTSAQIMLRWHVQEGRSAIPKSVTPSRISENFDVADFTLSAEEIAAIDALDTGVRGGPAPDFITLESHGREIPNE
ncbi:aldo/keto reductase [Humidisolicoccus flavus]|uniref:aldo/keto reductase n=1 Tax=Humidisolicoccus flavus TaxID=3111414 RepID=UPI00324F5BD5